MTFPAYLSADRVGQRAALRVLRGASPVQLDVTIGERTGETRQTGIGVRPRV